MQFALLLNTCLSYCAVLFISQRSLINKGRDINYARELGAFWGKQKFEVRKKFSKRGHIPPINLTFNNFLKSDFENGRIIKYSHLCILGGENKSFSQLHNCLFTLTFLSVINII